MGWCQSFQEIFNYLECYLCKYLKCSLGVQNIICMALGNENDIILGLRKDKGREIIIIAITGSLYAKMLLIREFGEPKCVFFFFIKSCTSFIESFLLPREKSFRSNIWYSSAPSKVEFHLWLSILNKLPIKDLLH